METKKTEKADLEKKKSTFFLLGILGALLLVFLAFEFVGTSEKKSDITTIVDEFPEEIPTIPTDPKTELPQPPKPQFPVFDITDKTVDIPDNIPTSEFGEGDIYDDIPYLKPIEDKPENLPPPPVIEIPDISAEFTGGEAARMRFIGANAIYPRVAKDAHIQGTVMVSFVVELDGSISDVKIIRSVHYSLDEEAIRVTKMMPKWTPGKQYGKAVRSRFNMPFKFSLEN